MEESENLPAIVRLTANQEVYRTVMLRFFTAGESHGKALIAFLEGLPSGLPIDLVQMNGELAKRQRGYGRSNRQKLEKDEAQILGGIRGGTTTGAPIALMIANRDAENWRHVM